MRFLSLIVLTFVILVGVTFSILNSEMVTIHYYVGTQRVPLSILILAVWIFGILIGMIISYAKLFKLKRALRRYHHMQG